MCPAALGRQFEISPSIVMIRKEVSKISFMRSVICETLKTMFSGRLGPFIFPSICNLPYFINLFNEMPIKNLMKTIVIFYAEDSKYASEKAFNGKSAVEITSEWAASLNLSSYTVKSLTLTDLLIDMKKICDETKSDTVLFSYNDHCN